MLAWIVIFFVLALIAGALGFGGLSSTFAWLAQILCVVFLVLFVASIVAGGMRRAGAGSIP